MASKKSTKKTVKKATKKTVKKAATPVVKQSAVPKKAVAKKTKSKAVQKSASVSKPKVEQNQEDVQEMLERLETFKKNPSKRKSVRPLSATVTMLSLIGILVSVFIVIPKSVSWGLGLIALFIILLIASIYSLTLE